MNPIDPFERHLPSALAEIGETRSPDYLTDILGRTARTRQRPAWASPERWLPMPMLFSPRVLAAMAVGMLVVVAAGFSVFSAGTPGPAPEPSPSVAPSAAAATRDPLPDELLGRWMGGPGTFSGLGANSGSSLLFTTDALTINDAMANQTPHAAGDASVIGVGTLELTGPADGCDADDTGRYRWLLSSTGLTLTLTSDGPDTCAPRGETLPGTWQRMGCKDPSNNCLGDVDAGEHASRFFTPLVPPGESWSPAFGQVRFTVPDGWAMAADWPNRLYLEPSDWYATQGAGTITDVNGIYALARPGAAVRSSTCDATLDPTIGTRAADLAAYLADHPDLDVGAPQPVTIGSMTGFIVDARLDPSVSTTCNGRVEVPLFAERGESGWTWWTVAGEEHRYVILDLDDDSTMLVDVGTAVADLPALLASAMPIVESFVIEP